MKQINSIRRTILLVLLAFVFSGLTAYADKKVYTIDVSVLNEEETAAVLALQGLANRENPQILIEPKNNGGFHGGGYRVQDVNVQRDGLMAISQATLDKYPALEDVWKEFYTSSYNYTFESVDFEQLFAAFADLYKGLVKYSSINGFAGIAIASTACGVLDAIPVTNNLTTKYSFLSGKTTLEDLTSYNFKSVKEAHRWAIDKYLTQTSKDYAFSFWNSERNYYTIDYAVANRLFSFALSFANEKIHKDGETVYPYDNEEAAMLDEIFAYLNPGSIILGWGEPNEYILQARCGEGGHALICTNVSPNLSLHAIVPSEAASLKQKRQLNDDDVTLENKIYITFSINEGDTYKSVGNVMMDGVWLHDKRGEIPFNWPTNPKILQMLPGLAHYYYETMTDNDYFMVPTSGIGYFDATFSTTDARTVYAQKGKEAAEYSDMHYMDVWWNAFENNDRWVKDMGMKGYTTWTSTQQVDFFKAVPCIESDMYYDLYNPPTKHKASNMAKYISRQTASVVDRPWFVHVYAADPTFAAEVMRNLSSDRFEAVCMDEFFALAIKAKTKIQGRKISKDADLIKQLNEDSEKERFAEEFTTISKWEAKDAEYDIRDGEMIITPKGTNYYTLVTKSNLKMNLTEYPFLAARVTQLPPGNVNWLIKSFDGFKDIALRGTDAYKVEGTTDVFAWDFNKISGWRNEKTTNLQLVMEAGSANDLQGFEMKFDWIRAYGSMEKLLQDLGLSGISENTLSDIKYSIVGDEIIIQLEEGISSAYLFDVTGKAYPASLNENRININHLTRGVYFLKVNNNQPLKILL